MKLSIRLKFLIVMCGLLFVCLGFYLLMSVTVFKSDKTQLVYDLNRSQVSNLASEIDTKLRALSDRLNLIAQLPKNKQKQLVQNLFNEKSDLVGVQFFEKSEAVQDHFHFSREFLETYGIEHQTLFQKLSKLEVPKDEILSKGESIWNSSIEGMPPLMGFGKRVLVLDENQVPIRQWVLVSYLKIDSFLKSISLIKLSDIKISNDQGQILVQRDAKALLEKPSIASQTLFQSAIGSPSRLSVIKEFDENQEWLSAFAKSYGNKVVVTARAPEREVFQVVRSLTVRTLLFGSIVLTLVVLAAFLLSRSLTRNIALLSRRMSSVSQGDLTTQLDLKGRDETVMLGQSFNRMIVDLKESRDELEIMNRELDQKVKDRTQQLEIQNQKVAEAHEALLRTARLASMGEVAGKAAHEVLNPLTSLLTRAGLTQKRVEVNYQQPLELLDEIGEAWNQDYREGGFDRLLKSWQEPSTVEPGKNLFVEDIQNINEIRMNLQKQAEEVAKDMRFIREEGDRIGKIVHGMRRLGNMKSEVKNQSAHLLLSDCCYIMADLFDQQRFSLRKKFDAEVDLIHVDRDEFIQSVTNMMRNSLQSMAEARVNNKKMQGYLQFSTSVRENMLVIEIEDNGLGISPDNQQKLFNVNFTTKSSDEGTGLGLSISRRFIRSYDGDIRLIDSVPLEKTIFCIQIPLVDDVNRREVA